MGGQYPGFVCRASIPYMGASAERSELDIEPPLGASLMIFP